MKRSIILLTILTLVAAHSAVAQDWKGTGRVQGQVTDEAQSPIEGAKVSLYIGEEGHGPEPIHTDKGGHWSILGLRYGEWHVLIEAPGKMISEGTFTVGPTRRKPIIVSLKNIPEEALVDEAAVAAKAMLENGNQYLAEGRYAEARSEYQHAMENLEATYHPMILLEIARTYYGEENIASAIETLQHLLELDPENVDALRLISDVLVSEGRETEAQEYIARLPAGVTLDPNALTNVGVELYNNGDLDGALAQFERVVSENPDFALGYYYRGLVYLAQQNNDDARADLQKYLELAPEGDNAAEAQEFLGYLEEPQ